MPATSLPGSAKHNRRHNIKRPDTDRYGDMVQHMVGSGFGLKDAVGAALSLSYAQMTAMNKGNNSNTSEFPPLGDTQRKKKLPPYRKCIGTPSNTNRLAAPKPEWLDNKVLVISRINKDFLHHKDQLHDLITEMATTAAQRPISIKHIEILSRVHSPWLTVAIELSENDFEILNNEVSWEKDLAVRPFLGRRYWRLTRRLSKEETRNSVKMSWAQN